jgi:hypothetical protein
LIRTHLRRCANRVTAHRPAERGHDTGRPDRAGASHRPAGRANPVLGPSRTARAGLAMYRFAGLVILAVTVIGAIAGIASLATAAITIQEAPHD